MKLDTYLFAKEFKPYSLLTDQVRWNILKSMWENMFGTHLIGICSFNVPICKNESPPFPYVPLGLTISDESEPSIGLNWLVTFFTSAQNRKLAGNEPKFDSQLK